MDISAHVSDDICTRLFILYCNSKTLETVKIIKDRELFICIMFLKVLSEKYKAQGKGDLTSILKATAIKITNCLKTYDNRKSQHRNRNYIK